MDKSYSDALQSLRTKKQALELELKQLNVALNALALIANIGNRPVHIDIDHKYPLDNLTDTASFLVATQGNSINSYYKDLTYSKKIEFILKQLGKATIQDMVDYIRGAEAIDDKQQLDRLKNTIAYTTSQMNIKGKLNTESIGRAYIYSLKHNDEVVSGDEKEKDTLHE